MWFGYYLGSLAGYLGQIAQFFFSTADDLQDVWIIGENLAAPFRWWGSLFYWAEDRVYALQDQWTDVYYHIDRWIDHASDLIELAFWNWDILDWVRNGFQNVKVIVDYYYPALESFMSDPRGTVERIVNDLVGDILRILDDLRDRVLDVLTDVIPDAWNFLHAPENWIINLIRQIRWEAADFLEDPENWIKEHLEKIDPDLDDFLINPAAFILPRLIAFIRARIAQFGKQLTDLATDILSSLF